MSSASGPGSASPSPLPHEQQRWGVLVGISSPDYSDIKRVHTPIGVYSATGVCGQELWVWIVLGFSWRGGLNLSNLAISA